MVLFFAVVLPCKDTFWELSAQGLRIVGFPMSDGWIQVVHDYYSGCGFLF